MVLCPQSWPNCHKRLVHPGDGGILSSQEAFPLGELLCRYSGALPGDNVPDGDRAARRFDHFSGGRD